MGNNLDKTEKGLSEVQGALIGDQMLEKLKEALITQKPFQTMFGKDGKRIYINEVPAYNETILPLWEFQWETETVPGEELWQTGFINSRILFPNNLSGKFSLYRRIAMMVSRYLVSKHCVTNFLKKVSGLTEFGEDIQFIYNQVFDYGQMTVPVLIMRIPFRFDLRRFHGEQECTDFDGGLDAALFREIEGYFVEIVDEENNVLIPKASL